MLLLLSYSYDYLAGIVTTIQLLLLLGTYCYWYASTTITSPATTSALLGFPLQFATSSIFPCLGLRFKHLHIARWARWLLKTHGVRATIAIFVSCNIPLIARICFRQNILITDFLHFGFTLCGIGSFYTLFLHFGFTLSIISQFCTLCVYIYFARWNLFW